MMKRPWEIPAAGFVLGEVLALAVSFVSLPAAAAGLAVLFAVRKSRSGKCRRLRAFLIRGRNMSFALLFLASFLLGALRYCTAAMPSKEERALDRESGTGGNGRYTELTVRVQGMERKSDRVELRSGCVLISVPVETAGTAGAAAGTEEGSAGADALPESAVPEIGNRVCVSGRLSRMPEATNPGQFSFADYYRAKGITHRLRAEEVIILDRREDIVRQKIYTFRNACEDILTAVCEPEDAGILRAALLGDRSAMDEDVYDQYRQNGIAHLLAISGLHMAIIGMGLYKLLRKTGLGFRACGMTVGIFLICYDILTGSGTSVMRAVTMLLLAFLAADIGRTYDLISAVCAAAVLILFFSPLELFQCGFQLSFIAVLSIGGPAAAVIRRYEIKKPLLQSLTVSLSVTLVSIPVVAYWFFSIPVYATLLNLIVIPLMVYAVWSGLGVLFLCRLSLFLAMTAAGMTHTVLSFYLFLCRAIQKLPFHRMLTGRPRAWQILLYYLLLGAAFLLLLRKDEKEQKGFRFFLIRQRKISCTAVLLLCILSLQHLPSFRTRIDFLDVGQGDAIVLRRGFSCVLIDGGSSTNQKAGAYILKPFLESSGIGTIETVFLTHADLDHTNAVEYLLTDCSDIKINNIFLNEPAARDEKYDLLKEEIRKAGVRAGYLSAGDVPPGPFRRGGGSLTCLSPEKGLETTETNEESLVLLYREKQFSCLFTGDAGAVSEEQILKHAAADPVLREALSGVTVLKAGHHGSKNSSSAELLNIICPEYAILSYGSANRYGHPHKEAVQHLQETEADILRTAESGCISFETDGEGMRVETYLD